MTASAQKRSRPRAPRSRRVRRWALTGVVLTAAVAATLAACAGNARTSPPANPVGTWGDAATPTEPSLELAENGSFVGTDGCNRLRGAWRNDDGAIRFTDVASTLMACEDIDTWLSALATGSIEGEKMTVFESGGAEIGKLARGGTKSSSDPAPGDGTAFHGTWGVEETTKPHLVLASDGTMHGSDGCNSLTGSWRASASRVEFELVATTMMNCEGVDEWLGRLASARLDGDTITIFDDDGMEIGMLRRSA